MNNDGMYDEILVSCPKMGVRYFLWACRNERERRNPFCDGCTAPEEAIKRVMERAGKKERANNVLPSDKTFYQEVG